MGRVVLPAMTLGLPVATNATHDFLCQWMKLAAYKMQLAGSGFQACLPALTESDLEKKCV